MIFEGKGPTLAIATVLASLAAPLACGAQPVGKLDAALTAVVESSKASAAVTPRMLRVTGKEGEARVRTILRYTGSLDEVKAQGAVIRAVMGDIATVEIPESKVAAVAALPTVVSIEAAQPVSKRLDISVPATRADALRTGTPGAWTGGTGKGVIVGIVDDGVDFRHDDFRKADGTTRILGLWDQRASGAAGAPPAGFTYGGECTEAMINAALGGDTTACTQPSGGGHGTHVGGIAAGNGRATGNGQTAYRMIGMAPDADILVANSIASGTGGTDAVLEGIQYMKAKAAALGKPLVVNLSLGSYFGARDGTSNSERAMDNLSGPGVILVGAAGNEGNAPLRASGTITQGADVTVGFKVPANVKQGKLEMWYPGSHAYSVTVTGPGCPPTPVVTVAGPNYEGNTACGGIAIIMAGPFANNDDRQILIGLVPGNTEPLKAGDWTVTIHGDVVAGGSAPFSMISGEDATDIVFTTHTAPVTTQILTGTASARRVIAVGAYTTRYTWNSLSGPYDYRTEDNFGALTDISNFSSRGPRRDCSNLAKCPQVMKPEITAPGAMIQAAQSFDLAKPAALTSREADGVHYAQNGTSMATPHVSGAIALLLQVNPQLTPEAAKQALFTTRQVNGFTTNLPTFDAAHPDTPGTPNYAWGYGILDAAAAVRSLQPAGSPVNVIEFYNAALDHYFITWVANEIAKLDNGTFKGWARTGQSFHVFNASAAGTSAVCRIYIPPGKGDGHFFGRDQNECNGTMSKNPDFVLESSSFFYLYPPTLGNCGAGQVPVYRVFTNRADANHRYTTDRGTRDAMVAKGWIAEGDGADTVVMCAPQ